MTAIMTRKSPKSQTPAGPKASGRPRSRKAGAATGAGAPGAGKAGERVAKTIARAGLGSRREAETWVAAGRVAINGVAISSPAVNVTAHDKVTVDGKPLPPRERTRLFLYHKPRGLVTTSADPEGRPTIFGGLRKNLPRLIAVGRLDLNTEGLLLLTNDGGLARVLELPETGWLRRYRVRAHGKVTQAALDGLREGIEVDGVRYGPIEATLDREQGSNNWLTFAMREGKNREIRNVLGALELQVNRLIRTSFGPFQLGELADGAVQEVPTRTLRDQIGERLAALSGADFTGPLIVREAPAPERDKPGRDEPGRSKRSTSKRASSKPPGDKPAADQRRDAPHHGREPKREQRARPDPRDSRGRGGHVWRDRSGTDEVPLRPFRKGGGMRAGSFGKAAAKAGPPDLVADRKGRRVVVERVAGKPVRPGRRPRGGKWRER
ncbi:MAG TPA: pseudouridine synthase [Xanthobacteraceae bacterium]|nr:pseudouridine synthase [Xanthobacteraceae bacterium]